MSVLEAHNTAIFPASFAGDVTPKEAIDALHNNKDAQLVDVRTHAEWVFAGLADLSSAGKDVVMLSLKLYPDFDDNPHFLSELQERFSDKKNPLYFLCKTGGRSTAAAHAAAALGYTHAYNIAGGMEGDLDAHGQRGKVNGWKAEGLAWKQA